MCARVWLCVQVCVCVCEQVCAKTSKGFGGLGFGIWRLSRQHPTILQYSILTWTSNSAQNNSQKIQDEEYGQYSVHFWGILEVQLDLKHH